MQRANDESDVHEPALGSSAESQEKKFGTSINRKIHLPGKIFPITTYLNTDVGDIPSSKAVVNPCDIFWILLSISTHIIDIITDLNLAITYLINKHYGYFTWTTVFLFVPSFINIVISIRMYKQDEEVRPEVAVHRTVCSRIVQKVVLWPFILVMQMAPILRHVDTLIFAIKSYNCRKKGDRQSQVKYYVKMLKEEQDIAVLRILECFLEAAPHQILQLTIMMVDHLNDTDINLNFVHQCGSLLSSLIGMGWAMSSYHRSIRMAQWDKENVSSIGNWLQFFWHFFITESRVMAITAAFIAVPIYTTIVIIIHWLVMTVWLVIKPAGVIEFCRDRSKPPHVYPSIREKICSYFLAMIFGVIQIFVYFKSEGGPTYWKYVYFYSVCSLENAMASLAWSLVEYTKITKMWYYEIVILLCTVPFVLGILTMIVYYKFFHPTEKRSLSSSVPCTADAANTNHVI